MRVTTRVLVVLFIVGPLCGWVVALVALLRGQPTPWALVLLAWAVGILGGLFVLARYGRSHWDND